MGTAVNILSNYNTKLNLYYTYITNCLDSTFAKIYKYIKAKINVCDYSLKYQKKNVEVEGEQKIIQ